MLEGTRSTGLTPLHNLAKTVHLNCFHALPPSHISYSLGFSIFPLFKRFGLQNVCFYLCHTVFHIQLALLQSSSPVATAMCTSLPQAVTNGNSVLGTDMAPQYPSFMTDNSLPDGYPWGSRTAGRTNPYRDCPQTGVTRYYNFTLQKMTLAPDGFGNPSTFSTFNW